MTQDATPDTTIQGTTITVDDVRAAALRRDQAIEEAKEEFRRFLRRALARGVTVTEVARAGIISREGARRTLMAPEQREEVAQRDSARHAADRARRREERARQKAKQ